MAKRKLLFLIGAWLVGLAGAGILYMYWTPFKLRLLGAFQEWSLSWPEVESAPLTPPDSDPLPPGALVRLGRARLRQNGDPHLLVFSPDGKFLASTETRRLGNEPGPAAISLWDVETGKEYRRLSIPAESALWSLAFSDGGEKVAAVGSHTISVWEVATGKTLRSDAARWRAEDAPQAVLSPDGKLLAWTTRYRLPILIDVDKGRSIARITGPAVADREHEHLFGFTADGKTLITGAFRNDTVVRFWDVASGEETHRLSPSSDALWPRCFSSDGKIMITRLRQGPIRVWDVARGRVRRELPTDHSEEQYFQCIALSADGRKVAAGVGYLAGLVRWWDAATGEPLGEVRAHPPYARTLAFSPDGSVLASAGGGDGAIHLWDTATGNKLSPREGHQAGITALDISPDGKTVVTVGRDQTLRYWDRATGAELRRSRADGSAVSFAPDGKLLAIGRAFGHGYLPLRDAETGEMIRRLPIGRQTHVQQLVFSPDGSWLAAGGTGQAAYLWNVSDGKIVREFRGGWVWAAAISADGSTLAMSAGEIIELWDLNRDQLLRQFGSVAGRKDASRGFSYLAFSPDGQFLAAAESALGGPQDGLPISRDGAIRVYDVPTGRERLTLRGHRGPVSSVRYSADGRWILSGGEDATVRLWDAGTGAELHRLEGHRGAVTAVAFAPDSQTALSASLDSTALVWEVPHLRKP
jgi:WD40 repeat protein